MIGLFDSGSGGLSVLTALRKRAPHVNILYFGDIRNAPYGTKSQAELRALTAAGIQILKDNGATEIVSACNSVSQSVLEGVGGEMPIIEMTVPTAHHISLRPRKRILLLATPATISAKIYQKALRNVCEIDGLPIPELAGAIEFGASESDIREIIQRALHSRIGNQYDSILLGCTHYPLVQEQIHEEAKKIGPLQIIDPAEAVAHEVVR